MVVFAGRLPEVLRLEAARLVRGGGRGGGAEDVDQVVGVNVLHLVLGPRGRQRLCNVQEMNICVFLQLEGQHLKSIIAILIGV